MNGTNETLSSIDGHNLDDFVKKPIFNILKKPFRNQKRHNQVAYSIRLGEE